MSLQDSDLDGPFFVRPNFTFWLYRLFTLLIGVALLWQASESLDPEWHGALSGSSWFEAVGPGVWFVFGAGIGLLGVADGLYALQVALAGGYLAVMSPVGVGIVTQTGWKTARWEDISVVWPYDLVWSEYVALYSTEPSASTKGRRIGGIRTGALASRTSTAQVLTYIARQRPDLKIVTMTKFR